MGICCACAENITKADNGAIGNRLIVMIDATLPNLLSMLSTHSQVVLPYASEVHHLCLLVHIETPIDPLRQRSSDRRSLPSCPAR
ncbi:hypothetical protein X989_5627 [Burkholderia pseudomallei MSHR4378]|nr:hypothetical protein X989_5627 [Burkholderia pseudomallei MSHR4378]